MILWVAEAASTSQPTGDFWTELYLLLPSSRVWAFGTVAALMGVLVVLADLVYFLLLKTSLLKLGYAGFWRTVLVFLLWGLGSGVVGVLGAVFGLFQVTLQAGVMVGLAWPVTLPRLLQAARVGAEEEQQV